MPGETGQEGGYMKKVMVMFVVALAVIMVGCNDTTTVSIEQEDNVREAKPLDKRKDVAGGIELTMEEANDLFPDGEVKGVDYSERDGMRIWDAYGTDGDGQNYFIDNAVVQILDDSVPVLEAQEGVGTAEENVSPLDEDGYIKEEYRGTEYGKMLEEFGDKFRP